VVKVVNFQPLKNMSIPELFLSQTVAKQSIGSLSQKVFIACRLAIDPDYDANFFSSPDANIT
jgi:hypothetical protein